MVWDGMGWDGSHTMGSIDFALLASDNGHLIYFSNTRKSNNK